MNRAPQGRRDQDPFVCPSACASSERGVTKGGVEDAGVHRGCRQCERTGKVAVGDELVSLLRRESEDLPGPFLAAGAQLDEGVPHLRTGGVELWQGQRIDRERFTGI